MSMRLGSGAARSAPPRMLSEKSAPRETGNRDSLLPNRPPRNPLDYACPASI